MKKLALSLFSLLLLSGCYTLNDTDLARPDSYQFGDSVNKPFEQMIANAQPVNREIGRVYFEYDKADITDEAKLYLDSYIQQINYRTGPVFVEGRTDHTNTDTYNKELGYKRALAVASYLRSAGVWGERMVIKSSGEARPSATNWEEEGRAINRCVVLSMYNQGQGMNSNDAMRVYRNSFAPPPEQSDNNFNQDSFYKWNDMLQHEVDYNTKKSESFDDMSFSNE
jgi:peptidoglycan-associated lipoprotein